MTQQLLPYSKQLLVDLMFHIFSLSHIHLNLNPLVNELNDRIVFLWCYSENMFIDFHCFIIAHSTHNMTFVLSRLNFNDKLCDL